MKVNLLMSHPILPLAMPMSVPLSYMQFLTELDVMVHTHVTGTGTGTMTGTIGNNGSLYLPLSLCSVYST